jgi:hypothetical protein
MEIPKVLPAEAPAARAGTATATEQGSQTPPNVAPPTDLVDIRPLDIPAALQILLAEARVALDLALQAAIVPGRANTPAPAIFTASPVQAARALVEMFLQAVPVDAQDPPVWEAILARVETAFQSSVDGAVNAVAAWRDVPAVVTAAATETRQLVFSVLAGDSQNPVWLRPEWAGFAPRIQRFWRRRRQVRRRLTDPDYPSSTMDEGEEFAPR